MGNDHYLRDVLEILLRATKNRPLVEWWANACQSPQYIELSLQDGGFMT